MITLVSQSKLARTCMLSRSTPRRTTFDASLKPPFIRLQHATFAETAANYVIRRVICLHA